MKKKLLFIYNPKAGKGLIRNNLLDILDTFARYEYEITALPTRWSGEARDAAAAMGNDYDLLVCSGGDGTLNEVAAGMIEGSIRTPLGYIPAGSTNDFASSLGISRKMEQAAEDAVCGEIFPCDMGKFNGKTFVYVAAFGLFTDVSYQTSQELKNTLGHFAYILEGVKRLGGVKAHRMTVESEECSCTGEFVFGMVTNSNSVGGFKNMTGKNVELNDGMLEVTLIRMPKNPIDIQTLVSGLLRRDEKCEFILGFKTKRMRITCEEQVAWTLDGEFGGEHGTVEIENLHEVLPIMVHREWRMPSTEEKKTE